MRQQGGGSGRRRRSRGNRSDRHGRCQADRRIGWRRLHQRRGRRRRGLDGLRMSGGRQRHAMRHHRRHRQRGHARACRRLDCRGRLAGLSERIPDQTGAGQQQQAECQNGKTDDTQHRSTNPISGAPDRGGAAQVWREAAKCGRPISQERDAGDTPVGISMQLQ
jgi:hypothetical protein